MLAQVAPVSIAEVPIGIGRSIPELLEGGEGGIIPALLFVVGIDLEHPADAEDSVVLIERVLAGVVDGSAD